MLKSSLPKASLGNSAYICKPGGLETSPSSITAITLHISGCTRGVLSNFPYHHYFHMFLLFVANMYIWGSPQFLRVVISTRSLLGWSPGELLLGVVRHYRWRQRSKEVRGLQCKARHRERCQDGDDKGQNFSVRSLRTEMIPTILPETLESSGKTRNKVRLELEGKWSVIPSKGTWASILLAARNYHIISRGWEWSKGGNPF